MSLLETLTVVTIVSVLVSAGLPSLVVQTERGQVMDQLRGMQSAVALARTRAILQGQTTQLQQNGPHWSVINNEGAELWREKLPDLLWRGFRGPPITFEPSGQTTNGSFWVCFGPKAQPRGLILSSVGRIRSSQDKNADGQHEKPNGDPFICP